MSTNAYYRSEPDPLWLRFKEDSRGYDDFYDDIRDYLLEEHSSTFTQFIDLCEVPLCTSEYWEELAESGKDVKTVIDNIFEDIHAAQQQRYLQNVVISSSRKH